MTDGLAASIDVMDISGQQQMGIVSRIVKIDLDESQKPINIAQSPILNEVPVGRVFHALEAEFKRMR